MASKTKNTATIKDWGEHPEVKKARAIGTVAAMEAAIDIAKKDKDFKPKERSVPISELKEAYEASRAQEAARLAKFEAALNRKPSSAVGGDAAPPMPEPQPPFPVTEIPRWPSKMMFGKSDLYDAIRRPYTYAYEYEIPIFRTERQRNDISGFGPYAQNPAPSFPEFKGFTDEKYAKGVAQGGIRNYDPDYGLPYPFNTKVKNWIEDWNRSNWRDAPSFYGFGDYYKLPFYLTANRQYNTYEY